MKLRYGLFLCVMVAALSVLGFLLPHRVEASTYAGEARAMALPNGTDPAQNGVPVASPERGDLAPDSPPSINVWYGSDQRFGYWGTPQKWVNILGNVTDPDGVASLVYSLNGGAQKTLSIGPDNHRLVSSGDFNVDIAYDDLSPGANTVVITARDNLNNTSSTTVTVRDESGSIWPRSYSIDWSSVSAIQDVAQVVDGLWGLEADSVRTSVPGYDRLIAIGDVAWDDYEVTVPIRIHSTNLNTAGVGILMRWPGHSDDPAEFAGWQPKTGWFPMGAIGWYRWYEGSEYLQIYGNQGRIVAQDTTGRRLSLNVTYNFKMRVETKPGQGGFYSFKVWQSGQAEPAAWALSGQEGLEDPQAGSFLLIAHKADASFGDVTVTPLTEGYVLTISKTGNGTVSPGVGSYVYSPGDQVTLTATPDAGWSFSGWEGPNGGEVVPTGPETGQLTMNGDKAVTAGFVADYTLNVLAPLGEGTVEPPPGSYPYPPGAVVTLIVTPTIGWTFDRWLDVGGQPRTDVTQNPDGTWSVTMDASKTVWPRFLEAQYYVDVIVEPDGGGTVSQTPEGPYKYNDVVTLQPIPQPYWRFADWSGPAAGELLYNGRDSWSLIMTGDKQVTANFVTYRVLVPLIIRER